LGPAELNNIVGFKPSRGLIGTDGAIPISSRQDVIGTLTRTVRDAAYLLSKMAGRNDRDERTWKISFDPIPDFTTFCKGKDLSGITVGIPRNIWIGTSPAPIEAFETALQTMRSAGGKVVENADFPKVEDFMSRGVVKRRMVHMSQ
jgi:amidase